MGIFSALADRVLGPADETTGQRPGDPTGITSAVVGMGTFALGAATAAAMAPDMIANIREGMGGLVSGARSVDSDLTAISASSTPAVVARASTPDLPALG